MIDDEKSCLLAKIEIFLDITFKLDFEYKNLILKFLVYFPLVSDAGIFPRLLSNSRAVASVSSRLVLNARGQI